MTIVHGLSIALNNQNKSDSNLVNTMNSNVFSELVSNRYRQTYKRNYAQVGIDEFGYSELIKLYGYADSERYARDPVSKSSIETTVFSVVKKKFVIKINPKYSESRKSKKLLDFIEVINAKLKNNYRQVFTELAISGLWYGKALSELIFDFLPSDHSDYPNFIYIKEIKNKFNGIWDIKEDCFNNIEAIESLIDYKLHPLEKFIFFVWNKQNGRNQGKGIVDSVWKFLNAKHILYKNMLIYIEKFTKPTPYLELPEFATQEVIDFCKDVVQNIHEGADLLLPHGVKAGFLEQANKGRDNNPFLVLFNWLDSQINLAIKGTTGLSVNNGTGKGTGSYASDRVKIDKEVIYEWLLETSLEELWFEQICTPILKMNFDVNEYPEKYYPIGVFEEDFKQEFNDVLESIKLAFEKGIYNINNTQDMIDTREKLKLRELSKKELKFLDEKQKINDQIKEEKKDNIQENVNILTDNNIENNDNLNQNLEQNSLTQEQNNLNNTENLEGLKNV